METFVAEWLLKEKLHLAALELYQELRINGVEVSILRSFFEKTLSESKTRPISSDVYRQYDPSMADKDRISSLECQIRVADATIQKLRKQLGVTAPQQASIWIPPTIQMRTPRHREHHTKDNTKITHTPKKDDNLSSDNESNDEDIAKYCTPPTRPVEHSNININQPSTQSTNEIKFVNYFVKKYLHDNKYRMAAIAFDEEIDGMEASHEEILSYANHSLVSLLCKYTSKNHNDTTDNDSLGSSKVENITFIKTPSNDIMSQKIEKSTQTDSHNIIALNDLAINTSPCSSNSSHHVDHTKKQEDICTKKLEVAQNLSTNTNDVLLRHEVSTLSEIVQRLQSQQSNLISILAERMPTLLCSLLPSKRECVLPFLILCLQYHPDASRRKDLSSYLLNLYKKPDQEQRIAITSSLEELSRLCLNSVRVEEEIFPGLLILSRHKYPERRSLSLHAISSIHDHLTTERLACSVVCIFRQLVYDASTQVREACVKTFPVILNIITYDYLYATVVELFQQLLFDTHNTIVKVTLQFFFPKLLAWAESQGILYTVVMHQLFTSLNNSLDSNNSDTNKTLLLLDCLSTATPFIHLNILSFVPPRIAEKYIRDDLSDDSSTSENSAIHVEAESPTKAVFDSFLLDVHTQGFEYLCEWPAVQWCEEEFIPRLIRLSLALPTTNTQLQRKCISLIATAVKTFGKVFNRVLVNPTFTVAMQSDKFQSYAPEGMSLQTFRERLLPVYMASVLGLTEDISENSCEGFDEEDLITFLTNLIISVASQDDVGDRPFTRSLLISLVSLSKHASQQKCIMSCLGELSRHTSRRVRATAAQCLANLLCTAKDQIVNSCVLPTLITLINDRDFSVRLHCIKAFCSLALQVTANTEVGSRLAVLFDNFFDHCMRMAMEFCIQDQVITNSSIPIANITSNESPPSTEIQPASSRESLSGDSNSWEDVDLNSDVEGTLSPTHHDNEPSTLDDEEYNSRRHNTLMIEWIKQISLVLSEVDSTWRCSHMIPKLVQLVQFNQQLNRPSYVPSGDECPQSGSMYEQRLVTASLLQAFRSILPCNINAELLQHSVVPSLGVLLTDIDILLDDEYKAVGLNLMRDLMRQAAPSSSSSSISTKPDFIKTKTNKDSLQSTLLSKVMKEIQILKQKNAQPPATKSPRRRRGSSTNLRNTTDDDKLERNSKDG